MTDDATALIGFWIVGVLVVWWVAQRRDVAPGFYILLSLLLSPIIGLIAVLLAKPGNRAPCWQCREQVVVGALKCPHCGAALIWSASGESAPG